MAAGYLSGPALAEQIHRTRELTDRPFGVNLFVLHEEPVDQSAIADYASQLAGEAERYGVVLGEPRYDDDAFAAKLDLVVAERVPVVSTTFSGPPPELVERVHGAGGEVWATVTSAAEARAACTAGADVLIAQGAEAGGHRGSWADDDGPDLELTALLSSDRRVTAGDRRGRDRRRAQRGRSPEAGATAVQAGTAFLLCPEAATSTPHRAGDRGRRRDGDDARVHRTPGTRDRERVHALASGRAARVPAHQSPDCAAPRGGAGCGRCAAHQSLGGHRVPPRGGATRGRDRLAR